MHAVVGFPHVEGDKTTPAAVAGIRFAGVTVIVRGPVPLTVKVAEELLPPTIVTVWNPEIVGAGSAPNAPMASTRP